MLYNDIGATVGTVYTVHYTDRWLFYSHTYVSTCVQCTVNTQTSTCTAHMSSGDRLLLTKRTLPENATLV